MAAELLHGRALRVLQQYRPDRGAADTDRSRRARAAAFVIASASIRSWSRRRCAATGWCDSGISIPKSRTTSGCTVRRRASCAVNRRDVLSDSIGALPGFGGGGGGGFGGGMGGAQRSAPLTRTRSIRIRISGSRRRSKISTTGSWASRRCSRRCMRSIRPSRNARTMAAEPFARKTGRCAICT